MVELSTYYGHYTGYNLDRLNGIDSELRRGTANGKRKRFARVFIMADTETSKSNDITEDGHRLNHIVCWSIALRYNGINRFCVYGRKPTELCDFLLNIKNHLPCTHLIIYFHNLSFDWQFIRKFCFKLWGTPREQLNTKSHYPVNIEFSNGIIFRDSLILAQVSLAKWSEQMNVEHGKAVGMWDYEQIRNQDTPLTDDELTYIFDDVLAGVECLDELRKRLNKRPYNLPWTATGIVREMTRKEAQKHRGHLEFVKQAFDYNGYIQCQSTYHGAYTHANRFYVNEVITEPVFCYDFNSSYPFVMLSEKFPAGKFMSISDTAIDGILRYSNDYAFLFKLVAVGVKLKDFHQPMPYLQSSKCLDSVNAVIDNGRILEADAVAIYLTEIDLKILSEQYTFEKHICKEVMYAKKDYLPRWFTDLVYRLYEQKCQLKYGDKTEYALSKARVNSLYGMCVQRILPQIIQEVYYSDEYRVLEMPNPEENYDKEIKKRGHVLNYQTGVWITAYACKNLFDLGKCCGIWLYSDTDSVYCTDPNLSMIAEYNKRALEKLQANGYDIITVDGHKFQLGEASPDGEYMEFVTVGAKRYAKRDINGKLSITVAGVPKVGYKTLNNDIRNFRRGLIFKGEDTGKRQHFYGYVDEIYVDENGNEQGDYVDLDPCDYLLDDIFSVDDVLIEKIGVNYYG